MPKRIGYLYERMIALDNCIQAEIEMAKNKENKNKMAKHIQRHADRYGATLQSKLSSGTYVFHKDRVVYIKDSYKGKTRRLQIPCLEDQAAMQAWLIIAAPYIEKRNYYYNCGSIPNAGQTRAVIALQKWLSTKKQRPKWGAVTDIKKFYETCPHRVVMRGLRRMFKDEKFLAFAEQMMYAMSPTGVGLAIGYPVSHWLANVALMEIDHGLRLKFPDVKHTRYMDDIAFVSNNKRHLRAAVKYLGLKLKEFGMVLKQNWQVFPIKSRGITFLSYRFFHGYTLLTKKLMYRISRKMVRASKHLTLRMAQGVISYMGILKHCNSYNYRMKHVYPYVNPKKCRRLISNASKDNVRGAA